MFDELDLKISDVAQSSDSSMEADLKSKHCTHHCTAQPTSTGMPTLPAH
jgi:hypothetical protein